MNCESSYCGRAGQYSYRTDRNCYGRASCSLYGDEGYYSRRTNPCSPDESSDEYFDDMIAETGSETDDLVNDEEDWVCIGSRRRTFDLSTVMEVDHTMRRAELDEEETKKRQMGAEKRDLEANLCDTKVKLQKLEERLFDTEEELDKKNRHIGKLEACLYNSDKEIECMQRRLSDKSLTIADQDHVIDDYKRRVVELQEEILVLHEKAKKELDSIESTKIKSLRDENKHLGEELQEAIIRLGTMKRETSTNSKKWQLKLREKENEISKLMDDLEKQTTDYDRKLNAFQTPFHWNKEVTKEDKYTDGAKRNINSKIDDLEKDIKELSKENKRLKEKLSSEKENTKRSKNQWDKRDTEPRRIKSLRDENKQLEQKLQEAITRLGKMEREASTNSKKWQLKVREKENEISKLMGDLEKQTTDYERKLNAFQKPFLWNKEVKKEDKHTDVAPKNINSKIDKLEKDIKELSKENKRLKEELSSEKENAKRSKNQWDKKDTELRRINESQKQELQALQERAKLLEQQRQNMHQQKMGLQVDSESKFRQEYKSLEESFSRTLKDLERCRQEKKKMQDDLTQQRDKTQRLEEEAGRQKGNMQQLINSRLREIESLKATNDDLTRQLNEFSKQKTVFSASSANDDMKQQLEATKEQLRNALQDRDEKLQKVYQVKIRSEEDLERCHQERKKLQDELAKERIKVQSLDEDVRREKGDLQLQIKSQLREIEMLKATNDKLTRQLDDLSKQKTVYTSQTGNDDLRRQLEATKEQLRNALKDRDEAQTRLSRAMGDRLTDNNPNIADLSDKNRPTKLSERYQELYDNQWTDAFEIIDRNFKDEEKTIATLKILLTRTMEFCKAEAARQLKQVEEIFAKGARIPKDMVKPLKDYRKALAEQYGEGLYKDYLRHLNRSRSEEDNLALQVPAFVKECFEICWLMAVQDPPVVLGPEIHRGSSFNKDHYKAYTKSGERVKFAVWPVLLLHEDGPVLCKGVAQGN